MGHSPVIERRGFLGLLGLGCACLAGPGLLAFSAWAAEDGLAYYTDPAKGLEAEFAQLCQGAGQMLSPKLGQSAARRAAALALESFRDELPRLPYVGGEANPDSRFIVVAAWYAALGRAFLPLGLSPEEVGKLVYTMNQDDLKRADPNIALAQGAARFTPQAYEQGLAWAGWTQKREYPGNWVAQFLVGDGRDFDFGYNYSECGVVKYLRGQGLPQLAPYVCLNDFILSRAQETGLARTTTLALGYERCDFRYKKGRAVTADWQSEAPKIAARARELGWS